MILLERAALSSTRAVLGSWQRPFYQNPKQLKGDFPRKCVTAYNPTRRISNDRQQIKRFSHANGQ